MKILFAIKSLNAAGGGAEKVLVEVANGLLRRGHEVKVLTFDFPGEAFYNLSPEIERRDMACNPVGQTMSRLSTLRAMPRMRAAIAAERPDVIVAFMHSTYVPLAFAAMGLAIPLVASEHTDATHYASRKLQRTVRKIVDRFATIRTVPSESSRNSFLKADGQDTVVVPNPISLPSQIRTFENSKIVTSVGVMRAEKDHAVLLDAFAQVTVAFPDWRLQIVGDGPLRGDLERQVARLGLGAQVEMPGLTRDVGTAYAKSQFVVLPSRYESFGMVAAEALAAGRAVLSFDDCGGIAEIVESGQNGLLVAGSLDREARVTALATGLRQMMDDSDQLHRMGKNGPASVARFGLEPVLDRWEEICRNAINHRGVE